MPVDNGTIQFVAYAPPQPIGRRWQVLAQLAQKNRTDDTSGELQKFSDLFQDVIDILLDRIDRFPEITDYELAPEAFLPAILDDIGNPFEQEVFNLSEVRQRQLASVLRTLYAQKGTDPGLINAIRFLVGVTVTIRCVYRDQVWILDDADYYLGEDGLDEGTAMCGPGVGQQEWKKAFEVISPVELTAMQRTQIIAVVKYMQPRSAAFKGIVEP